MRCWLQPSSWNSVARKKIRVSNHCWAQKTYPTTEDEDINNNRFRIKLRMNLPWVLAFHSEHYYKSQVWYEPAAIARSQTFCMWRPGLLLSTTPFNRQQRGGIRGGENLLLAACSTLMTLYVTGCYAKLFIVMIAERPKRSPCATQKLGKSFEIHCVDNIQK